LPELIEREVASGERIVSRRPAFVAFCPYASRFPYELWIAPRQHQARYEDVEPGELGELSRLVRDCIGRIERAVGPLSYNYLLHTQPFDSLCTTISRSATSTASSSRRIEDSYLPFLDVFEQYDELPIALHTSGPLMEWLDERHPEYVDRLARWWRPAASRSSAARSTSRS
jgi:galactose-1-phosphate uridylyltransferase